MRLAIMALIASLIMLMNPPAGVERPLPAFWVLEATLALGVLATPRFLIRAASDLSDYTDHQTERVRTLLYGAG